MHNMLNLVMYLFFLIGAIVLLNCNQILEFLGHNQWRRPRRETDIEVHR